MNRLESFIAALKKDNSADFLQAVDEHVGKFEGCNVAEVIESAPKKRLAEICEGLRNQVELGVNQFTTPFNPNDQDAPEDAEAAEIEKKDEACEVLLAAAMVARMILAECKESAPEPLLQAVAMLHDNALLAAVDYPALQEEVSKVCLDWWQMGIPGREQLMPQTVPYLIVEALQAGTATSVKRCHAMRSALELFDFEDPSIGDLKRLLLRAAFAPAFLRSSEGRRFLSYLFTLQPAFVKELTAIVKNQIPAGRKSVLDAYGEIIYRAWSSASGACLLEIQDGCIQPLMEAAIFASTQPMGAAVRRVLNGLHCQKHQPGVDRMLLELYEPILFRNLNAANPEVRRNALRVFVDAFPLRDPDEANDDTDRRMNEQFQKLSALLKDDVPTVRAAAIQGICRILNTFWEVIPGAVTAGYVKVIAGDLAFDAASPAVRAEAAEGIATLVDNPLAQPLLKVVLPKMEPLLFDSSLRVRTAMVDLLLELKGIQSLPWHECFNVKNLLDIMAFDAAPVAERIQKLLLPSYFPDLISGPALVAALLRASPEAGQAFCLYLAGVKRGNHLAGSGGSLEGAEPLPAGPAVQPDDLLALAGDLTTHLLEVPMAEETTTAAAGKSKGQKKSRSKRKKKGEDADEEEEMQEVVESPESWAAILGGLEAVCCGLSFLVASGQCEVTEVNRLFRGGELTDILDRCRSAAARSAVYSIAACLPTCTGSIAIRNNVMAKLMPSNRATAVLMEEDSIVNDATELKAALLCAASFPKTWHVVLHSVAKALGLEELPDVSAAGALSGAIKPGKKASNVAVEEVPVGLALKYLSALIDMESSRKTLVASGTLSRLIPCLTALLNQRIEDLDFSSVHDEDKESLVAQGQVHDVLMVCMSAALHLALAARQEATQEEEQGKDLDKSESDRSETKVEAVKAICEVLSAARAVMQRLQDVGDLQLLEALGIRNEEVRPKRSKASKKSTAAGAPSPSVSSIAAAVNAARLALALSVEACQLGVIDTKKSEREAAATATAMLSLASRVHTSAQEVDRNPGTYLSITVSHCACLARGLAQQATNKDLVSAFDECSEGEDAVFQGSVEGLVQALMAAVVKLDGAITASRPHLCGLLASLAAGPHGQCIVRPLLEMPDAMNDENADTSNVRGRETQKAALTQVVAAAKFAKVAEYLAGQAAVAALAKWTSGEVDAAVGAVELSVMLGFNGISRGGRKKGGQFEDALTQLQKLNEAVEDDAGPLKEKLRELFPSDAEITVAVC